MTRRGQPSRRGNHAGAGEIKPELAKESAKSSKKAGGKKSGAWAEPTPAQIERSVRDSRLPLTISLEIGSLAGQAEAEAQAEAPRLRLVDVGVNSWQEFVELQRVVDSLQRPTRTAKSGHLEEDELEGMVFLSGGKPELQLSVVAVNSIHKFATMLALRAQSLGLPARSLLNDRVFVRLPVGSAAANTRKVIVWDAVVVAPSGESDPSPSIQRVLLPPVQAASIHRLAQLRHPRLVPLVDAMLADHAASGAIQVVILRGIPGSGKSSLGVEVVSICDARGVGVVVCSADQYFETARGYKFDVKGIAKAHEASQSAFRSALQSNRAPIVVVDNTNTQRWEYDEYEQIASEYASTVHILEMHCPDVLTCTRMAQRNSHGVSVVKVMAMYLRWTSDERAVVFPPSFQEPLVLDNPVTRNPVNNYVAYVGLFIDPPTRQHVLNRVPARHANVVAEHVTLFFRPTTQYIRQAPIGKKFKIRVTNVVEDDRGQALQVEMDDRLHLQCRNKTPHITLSTAEGVSAFYSNELLDDPKASRSTVESFEIDVTLGVALMAQSRKIVSLTSPFANQFALTSPESELFEPPQTILDTGCQVDSVVILDVSEADLASDEEEDLVQALLRHEIVRHSCGPHARSYRIVAVRQSSQEETLDEETIARVKAFLSPSWVADALGFDTVVGVKSSQTLCDTINRMHASPKRVTVLTTQAVLVVKHELSHFSGSVSIKQLPRDVSPVHRLAPDLDASLTRALDAMHVSTTEETCHTVQMAIQVAEQLLAKIGLPRIEVMRVDSALWVHPSAVIDIRARASLANGVAQDLLVASRSLGVRDARVVAHGSSTSVVFQLPTRSTQAPRIRWVLSEDGSGRHLEIVHQIRRAVRDALTVANQEVFPRLVAIVGAVLRSGIVDMEAKPTHLQLLSERIVLAFLEADNGEASVREAGSRQPADYRVLWARIAGCLRWLAAWTSERWAAEVHTVAGDSTAEESAAVVQRLIQRASEAVDASSADGEGGRWAQRMLSILRVDSMAFPSGESHRKYTVNLENDSIMFRDTVQ